MRLLDFHVTGFKNLRSRVSLEQLAAINVIHGPNNVGKSNLLQAIALLFRCLEWPPDWPAGKARVLDGNDLRGLNLQPRHIFNLEEPAGVTLEARLSVEEEELKRAGLGVPLPIADIDIAVVLAWNGEAAEQRITRFRFGGADVNVEYLALDDRQRVQRLAKFLARNLLVSDGPNHQAALVGVRRDIELDPVPRPQGSSPLALEMYDCRESLDTVRRDRWRAFVDAMREFQDVTGEGVFDVTFQRSEGQARLVFDTPQARIPLHLMGTGVQQVVALLGHTLLANSSIVAIEEPELNLRWDLQDKLRRVLERLVSETPRRGPAQIFLSSHSAAFEVGSGFYLLEPGDAGPRLSRRSVSEAPLVLRQHPHHADLPERASQAYLSSQGVVRVPEHIRQHLGLSDGGGVVFLPGQGEVKLLSDEQLLDRLGAAADGEDGDG